MKIFDKFLKVLKTNRTTFFAYILTLITAYIMVDRIVEFLFMAFTGMSVDYWGPIKYTLAIACAVFAFLFSYSSKFIKSDEHKISFFYVYCISLYVIGISMVIQWLNHLLWVGILAVPNYEEIITEFPELIRSALTAITVYIPLTTFYKLITFLLRKINNPILPNEFKDAITDFGGISLDPSNPSTGPYSYEITFCNNKLTNEPVKIIEKRRFETTLVIGPSGTGKTAMVMEPMIARDLEKKFFFRETAKEMGYTALKTGIATLNYPYDNDYINKNFRLNMLTPVEGKESVYKAYMRKMIYYSDNDRIVYKDLGLTSVSPDFEHTKKIIEIAKAFNLPIHVIDPLDPNSPGLNPFIIKNPNLCAVAISFVLKSLYPSNGTVSAEVAYMEDFAYQAIQNLSILIHVMYPRLNEGLMPNLEDLLRCLNDFSLVENMCNELIKIEELKIDYDLQIQYFKQNFYKGATGYENMKRYVHFATAQLDNLLRSGYVRNIICNRHNNINCAEVLENGELVALSSRPTEIGGTAHQGFGKFFLFLFMVGAEGRPGNENSRMPHFLYVDEFNMYDPAAFSDMFTLYRKFKIGTILSAQNLSQLGPRSSSAIQSLLSNASTKISFGNNTPEDYSWWEEEFGTRKEWVRNSNYDMKDIEYSTNLGNVAWDYKKILRKEKIQSLAFKQIVYKTKDVKGKNLAWFGKVDFLEAKYKEPHKTKTYKFDKFTPSISTTPEETKKEKFNPKKVIFDDSNGEEIDPIKTDTTDSSYFFNNEDAISIKLNKKSEEKKN